MHRFVVTFSAPRAGYGLTIGSNEPTKRRAFRYARRIWEATAPARARCDLASVSVKSAAELDQDAIARPCVGFAEPRKWWH